MTQPPIGDRVVFARSALFVPGSRPDRFDSAVASGADLVIVDLEDSVAPDDKPRARENIASWRPAGRSMAVRINPRGTHWYEDDMALVAEIGATVMVPKTEHADDIEMVRNGIPEGTPIIGLVETPVGVAGLQSIVSAPGLSRLAFGNVDLGACLGVDPDDREAMLLARTSIVVWSSVAGLAAPLEGVTTSLTASVSADAADYAARLGFGGKLCIHPIQVVEVNRAFTPTAEALNNARRILGNYDGGVMVIDGRMVDEPVASAARRLVQRAALSAAV